MSYKVIIHRPGIERATAREAVMTAHSRLGMGQDERTVDAHAAILAKAGKLDIEHGGVVAHIELG